MSSPEGCCVDLLEGPALALSERQCGGPTSEERCFEVHQILSVSVFNIRL